MRIIETVVKIPSNRCISYQYVPFSASSSHSPSHSPSSPLSLSLSPSLFSSLSYSLPPPTFRRCLDLDRASLSSSSHQTHYTKRSYEWRCPPTGVCRCIRLFCYHFHCHLDFTMLPPLYHSSLLYHYKIYLLDRRHWLSLLLEINSAKTVNKISLQGHGTL